MNNDELLRAVPGASEAECAVCVSMTIMRIPQDDGFVPICSESCVRAWPHVRALRKRIAALKSALDDCEQTMQGR